MERNSITIPCWERHENQISHVSDSD